VIRPYSFNHAAESGQAVTLEKNKPLFSSGLLVLISTGYGVTLFFLEAFCNILRMRKILQTGRVTFLSTWSTHFCPFPVHQLAIFLVHVVLYST
jgi:hypothetical protein